MRDWEKRNEQFYDKAFQNYFNANFSVDLSHLYFPFLKHIPTEGKILDAGCGPGRDAKRFIEMGYQVDAFDLSEEMVNLASTQTGIQVQKMSFTEIDVVSMYDGVWCNASLLHIPSEELKEVLAGLVRSLKENGVVYASFKFGAVEGIRNGRYFNDMDHDKFIKIIPDSANLINAWETQDVRKGREKEKWFNVIIGKK